MAAKRVVLISFQKIKVQSFSLLNDNSVDSCEIGHYI